MASGNITRTPDLTLTDSEYVTNAKINRVGGGTYRVDEGAITGRELGVEALDWINVKKEGAVGDGTTDDTLAIQAVLDANRIAFLPIGKYRITSKLTFSRGSGIVGENCSLYPDTSQTGQTWDGTKESVLYYDGSDDSALAMIFASAEEVGTQVTSSFDNSFYSNVLRNFVIDGNEKAGFGIYAVRPYDWLVDNIVITGTKKHGMYLCGAFAGRFSKIAAFKNEGCGITIGRGAHDYGWTTNYQVNACVFHDLYAAANGSDKQFDESSNADWGYGIGLYWHRANTLTGFTSELNDGVGLYVGPSSGPNVIRDGYLELNCYYDVSNTYAVEDGRTTQGWGLWFEGMPRAGIPAASASLHNRIENVFIQGGNVAQGIYLEGTNPSSGRPEGGLELSNFYPSASLNTHIKIASDGNMNSSSATLTTTDSSPFSAGMVGDTITVTGAGAAGANLTSTIATFVGTAEVTLNDTASTSVTNKVVTTADFIPITSTFSNFRLVNCSGEIADNIQGTQPTAEWSIEGGVGFGLDALENFDEGTWTPEIYGSSSTGVNTYSVQAGTYTQIGKRMIVNGKVVLSSKDPGMSGSVRLRGFPLKSSSAGNRMDSGGTIVDYGGIATTGRPVLRIASTTNGIMSVNIYSSGPTQTELAPGEISDSADFTFEASYPVD